MRSPRFWFGLVVCASASALFASFAGCDESSSSSGGFALDASFDSPVFTVADTGTVVVVEEAGTDAAADAPVDAPLDVTDAGVVPAGPNDVFDVDPSTLAVFELNGSLADTSGHGRNPTPWDPDAGDAGGTFAPSSFGQSLVLPGDALEGFDWTAYAPLLTKPYTLEIVIVPTNVGCWGRLFTYDLAQDNGLYLCSGFQSYPSPTLSASFPVGERLYLAIVVHGNADAGADAAAAPDAGDDELDVYANGTLLGTTPANYSSPPPQALFFKDNTSGVATTEYLPGTAEAVRISSGARTPEEIAAVQVRLATRPSDGGI
jgi:hypothetical protein